MNGAAAMIFNVLVTFAFPVGVLIFLIFKKRYLPSFLLGVITFLISQALLRMPLLAFLQKQQWYISFSQNHLVLFVILVGGLSAGLFEEGGRWLSMRYLLDGDKSPLKGRTTWYDALFFGLGHGGFEAFYLAGVPALQQLVHYYGALRLMPAGQLPVTGLERIFAMLFHIGLSMIVMCAVRSRRPLLVLAALALHTAFNSIAVLVNVYTGSLLYSELCIGIFAAGMLVYTALERQAENRRKTQTEVIINEKDV